MREILTQDILDFLEKEKIQFECNSELDERYSIASLFNPVEGGFYFFMGNKVPESITDSLVLLKKDKNAELGENNVGIFLTNHDPQKVYYKLLDTYYKTKSNGTIFDNAIIHPEAKIGKNVQIDHFTYIGKAIIEDNVIIKSHCNIHDNSIIRKNVIIESHSVIGAQGVAWVWDKDEKEKIVQPQLGGVEVEQNCVLGAGTIIVRGSLNENSKIGKNTLFAPGCRIGHGTQIGESVHFANNVITGGNTKIGNYCFVGSAVVFRPKVIIDDNTIIGAGAVVVKNTSKEGMTLMGVPAEEKETKENPSGMPKPKTKN